MQRARKFIYDYKDSRYTLEFIDKTSIHLFNVETTEYYWVEEPEEYKEVCEVILARLREEKAKKNEYFKNLALQQNKIIGEE